MASVPLLIQRSLEVRHLAAQVAEVVMRQGASSSSTVVRLLCLALVFVGSSALGQEPGLHAIAEEVWPGQVTQVRSADSLVVVYGGTSHQFRLEGIRVVPDFPVQGDVAAKMLRERLVGKSVQIRVRGYVEGGKVPVGLILLVGGADARVDMITQGLVAYCPRYVIEAKLQEAQRRAREAGRGLWGSPKSQPAKPCQGGPD
jgi:endonuclease YncB( thermonuclease family)